MSRLTFTLLFLGSLPLAAQQPAPATPSKAEIIARAKALELNTRYVPPPGEPLVHHAAGYAKVLCSAVFISGHDVKFAAENLGYFVAPYSERQKFATVVDREKKEVHVDISAPKVRRTARYVGDLGCVTLPVGEGKLHFTPRPLPKVAAQPFATASPPSWKVGAALDAAFADPAAMTAAVVVTWKGRIIGERYAEGIASDTPLESWSMGKSLIATLMGVLIQSGVYDLWQPAPIPEWSTTADDPRRKIRIGDLLRMSSGLRIKAPNDPEYDGSGYPDHLYLYTGSENLFQYAATRPQQWPPNTVGRYRNTDPVLTSYLIRLGVEKQKQDYLSFPRRALLGKLGMNTMVMETDAWGNYLTQGYELASARDWARLANLYLQDGIWNNERILPAGFAKFVSTPAPAWLHDGPPEYGGFFWLNGLGRLSAPADTYFMAGAGGQFAIIIPSRNLVMVRLGHYKGGVAGQAALNSALKLLLEAIPDTH
ncbi:MAG TPA: serine hydrolase [Bryobacteraceae bacterium]|nr:serine hydrolase [Bryobacteraceae bacterium]